MSRRRALKDKKSGARPLARRLSTKIHLKTDFDGLPIAVHLTGGEASDSRNFETLLDIGPDITPRAALADKGYDFERQPAGGT